MLLNLTQAAQHLGRKPNGFRKLVKSGRGPRFQRVEPAGHFYFKAEWLDEWVEETSAPIKRKQRPVAGSLIEGFDSRLLDL